LLLAETVMEEGAGVLGEVGETGDKKCQEN
jgi:hypothetical protein